MGAEQQSIWLWRSDDDIWELFDARDTYEINTALSRGEEGMVLQKHSNTYFIDLQRHTQTNVETGNQRRMSEIKPNSEWLRNASSNNKESIWQRVSQKDALEMERALFARRDSTVLERGSDVYYVDFTRWTQTNLTTGKVFQIKVKSKGLHRRDSSASTVTTSSVNSHPSTTVSSNDQCICCHQHLLHQPQHHHHHPEISRQHQHPETTAKRPASPHTVLDDDDYIPFGSNLHESSKSQRFRNPQESSMIRSTSYRSSSNKAEADRYVWHWKDNDGAWSVFDQDIMGKLEEALKSGEESVMFLRDDSAYYLCLNSFTQTNVNSGAVREVRRMQTTTS